MNLVVCCYITQKHNTVFTLTCTPWTISADDKLLILFLFFPENMPSHSMQSVSLGDDLHEIAKPIFWEK